MKSLPYLMLLCVTLAVPVHAQLRMSASYAITTETNDVAGNHTTSANYTNDGSAGSIVGISTVASPAETAKDGYIGQLTELSSFSVTAAPNNIPQGTTSQLSGSATLDDNTTTTLGGSAIVWNSVAYPFQSISNAGLLTAVANVYSNPAGSVGGTYLGATSFASVTVTGPYSNSVIPDSWFVQYFGAAPNPNADPSADADHTGQSNLFKYVAGLNPLDPTSRFLLRIESVVGQPGQKNLIFSPRLVDRMYTVNAKSDLTSGSYTPLGNSSFSDNGQERTVTDFDGSGPAKFYEVEITKP